MRSALAHCGCCQLSPVWVTNSESWVRRRRCGCLQWPCCWVVTTVLSGSVSSDSPDSSLFTSPWLRLLSAAPVRPCVISKFEEILDPTPESLTDEIASLRHTLKHGVTRRITDGVAIIFFNAVHSPDPSAYHSQLSLDIERLQRSLEICGFHEIQVCKPPIKSFMTGKN